MMKKFISYKLIGLGLIMAGIAGCDTADQDVSPIVSTDGYTTATFTQTKGGTTAIAEGDTLIFNVKIDKMIERSITFSARAIGGPGTDADFEVTPGVIKPYTSETNVQIVFLKDWVADENEAMKLEVGAFSIADRYIANPESVNPVLDLTISNYISDVLTITCDWDKDKDSIDVYEIQQIKINVGTYTTYIPDTLKVKKSLGANMDWDMLVYNIAQDSVYDNATGQTGSCPEVVEFGDLPDGDYFILSYLYKNYLNNPTAPTVFYNYADSTEMVPMKVNFQIQGTTYNLDDVNDVSEQSTVIEEAHFIGLVAQVNISSGKYTITDFDGTETGPWKKSDIKESILNRMRNK